VTARSCDECGKPCEGDDLHGNDPRYCLGHQYLARLGGQRFAELMRGLIGSSNSTAGSARQCQWQAEDGWLIVYTTSRVEGGEYHGKFLAMAYRPEGKGARSGKPTQWTIAYRRPFATRKTAKARATALYYRHSPRAAARHGITPEAAS
jgi:hypothetical protein